jgi:hypothetical protein
MQGSGARGQGSVKTVECHLWGKHPWKEDKTVCGYLRRKNGRDECIHRDGPLECATGGLKGPVKIIKPETENRKPKTDL